MKQLLTWILFLSLIPGVLDAQIILKRQVLSSFGGSETIDSNVYISHTLGQPPLSGTENNGEYLRQGFEQPKGLNLCGILNNFIVEEIITECGTYYSVEYTGTTSNNMTFDWDFGENAIPQTSSDQNVFEISYQEDGSKIITLVVTTENGCETSASKNLKVTSGGFTSVAEQKSLTCEDETSEVEITVLNGVEPYTVEWEDGNADMIRTDLGVGTFAYTVSDNRNCSHSGSVTIDFENPKISIDAEVMNANCDTTVLGSIELIITGGIGQIDFDWSNGATKSSNTDLIPGIYSVTVSDSRGCEEQEEYSVMAECITEDILPNTISPNGDNVNDTWVVPGLDNYPNNELEIFNRWGSSIYSAGPYRNNWSGTNDDNEFLPLGAYYYVLKLNDVDNTILQGSITIVK